MQIILTKPQRKALRRLHVGPGFVPIVWIGKRVCRALVTKGLALTTTTGLIAPTPYGRWVARTMPDQRELLEGSAACA